MGSTIWGICFSLKANPNGSNQKSFDTVLPRYIGVNPSVETNGYWLPIWRTQHAADRCLSSSEHRPVVEEHPSTRRCAVDVLSIAIESGLLVEGWLSGQKQRFARSNRLMINPHEANREAWTLLAWQVRLVKTDDALAALSSPDQKDVALVSFHDDFIGRHQGDAAPG
jgi:hypothetical protein